MEFGMELGRAGEGSRPGTSGSSQALSEARRTQPEAWPRPGGGRPQPQGLGRTQGLGDTTVLPEAEEPVDKEAEREARVAKLWQRLDRDSSGSIDKQELDAEPFHEVIRGAVASDRGTTGGASHSRSEMNMKAAIDFAMRKAEGNKSGELSFKEFRSLLFSLTDPSSSTADLAFALFDLDQGGTIDKKEFKELLRFFLGRNPTYKDFAEQWELLTSTAEHNEEATKWQYIAWLRATLHPKIRAYAPPVGPNETSRGAFRTEPKRSLKMHERPKWNPKFNTGPSPGHLNDKRPQGERLYFSKSQSLPQLRKFYKTYGDHFNKHMGELDKPLEPRTTSALHPKILSSEGGTPLTLPERHCPAGTMRDHKSQRVTMWEDYWRPPARFTKRFSPSDRPLALRAAFGEPNDKQSRWAAETFGGGHGRGRWNGGEKKAAPAGDQRLDSSLKVQHFRGTALEAVPW